MRDAPPSVACRAALVLVEPDTGLIVGTSLARPDEVLERAPAMFLEATGAPLVGAPRLPSRVRVAAPDLFAALLDRVGDVDVVLAPTPELDPVVSSAGMSHVTDGCQEGGVDQSRADAEERLGRGETGERIDCGNECDGSCLKSHASRDEPLATQPVGERARGELRQAPYAGVDSGEGADLFEGHARGGEMEGKEAPGHAVVEVVDQAGLAHAGESAVGDGRAPEDLAL